MPRTLSPNPTDYYRVEINSRILQNPDGADVIISLPVSPSDPEILSALKRAGILMKNVRTSQLTFRDSQGRDDAGKWGPYKIRIYSKRRGFLLTLVEVER